MYRQSFCPPSSCTLMSHERLAIIFWYTSLKKMQDNALYLLLLPQLAISLTSWAQIVLSINRYKGCCNFRYTDVWGLLLLTHGAFVRWIAALATRTASVSFQIVAALIAATIGWTSFVVIFNEDFVLPTRQQTWSLLMSLVVTILWELNNRLLFTLN